MEIIGNKSKGGGGGSSDGGENRGQEISSVAYMKILLALSEGEIAGGFTGKQINIDGTPLLDDSGNSNFPGVTWEFRSGTQDQDYIPGFPSVENETNIGTEIKYGTPWVKAITNTQLSAVRVRFKFPNGVYYMRDSGGKDGYRVEFAIDLSTDGSTYEEIGRDAADGIANSGYERSYRIDLPPANSGWQIRIRRLTANTTDGRHADMCQIESMTEIVDAKLRYPNTALLFIQFDAKLFDGRTPTVTVLTKGMIIRVPSNYDPNSRTYTGEWDGTFKWAWSNNPAWVFYDLVLSKRYGLGKRISADQVDKWTLYQIGKYCDERVSDGVGGLEPRFLCDLYLKERTDAWTVLLDLISIFRGMLSWSNNLLSVDADMPREMDPDFVFNKSNIVGSFNFSSTSEKTNYSAGIITYSNPSNGYRDDQTPVHVKEVSARFGFNTLEMSAIGCTRETEAQRRGLWAIETNRDDNAVEFITGTEGRVPRIGKVIGVNNPRSSGRQNGGRVAAVSGNKITLDRDPKPNIGDRLIINLPTGKAEGRKIKSVSGRAITVDGAYSVEPNVESGWVLDQPDLAIQQFRVKRISIGEDRQITISGLPYNPSKFARIDDGAVIDERPVTVVPPRGQQGPTNITLASSFRVEQGISITTLEVSWGAVENAIAYEAQWRQNSGEWINVARTGNTRFEVDGIYAGRYLVRIRAINAVDIASIWVYSDEIVLTGKVGKPPLPVNLRTGSLLWGIQIDWGIPIGAEDTSYTEIQYAQRQGGADALLLCDVPFPQSTYTQTGLRAGQTFFYRARLVDRIGNVGDWTDWFRGMANAAGSDYLGSIGDDFMSADDGKKLSEDIDSNLEEQLGLALGQNAETDYQMSENGNMRAEILKVSKVVTDQGEALAESSEALKSQIGNVTTTLEDKMTTVVKSDGASAIHTLKAGVEIDGVYYSAGMSIAVMSKPGVAPVTRVGFNANQFVLTSGSGDAQYSPFAIIDGQVFIDTAFIQHGTISNAMIGDDIQSNDYVAGQSGWRISKTDGIEINGGKDGNRITINSSGFFMWLANGGKIYLGEWGF